jgi:sirohydrochlorin ferrochelatase
MSELPAIMLIAHGSRCEEANLDTRLLVKDLIDREPGRIVREAFLELAQPDIDAAAAECVACGARCVVLLPHFLSAGVHVQRDLGDARARLSQRFPEVEFRLAEPIGRHPLLIEILSERARTIR